MSGVCYKLMPSVAAVNYSFPVAHLLMLKACFPKSILNPLIKMWKHRPYPQIQNTELAPAVTPKLIDRSFNTRCHISCSVVSTVSSQHEGPEFEPTQSVWSLWSLNIILVFVLFSSHDPNTCSLGKLETHYTCYICEVYAFGISTKYVFRKTLEDRKLTAASS